MYKLEIQIQIVVMVVLLNQAFKNWNKVLQVCQQLFSHKKSQ